jgi:hypothetical protein
MSLQHLPIEARKKHLHIQQWGLGRAEDTMKKRSFAKLKV